MNRLAVQTSHGALHFVGRLHAAQRPTLLVIPGVFPLPDYRHEIVDDYVGVNVLVANLPGMDVDWLATPRPQDYSAAFDEAMARLVPEGPLIVYGISTGCLVSLGMRAPNLFRHIAEEPFDSTAELWPTDGNFRRQLEKHRDNEALEAFMWSFFGLSRDAREDRDYGPLLEGISHPTDVFVGEKPLEPERQTKGWPSLTSARARAILGANPLVTLHQGPVGSGHGYGTTPAGKRDLGVLVLKALHAAARTL